MSDSKKYSVDDILADIMGEKEEEQPLSKIDIDVLLKDIIAEKSEKTAGPKVFIVEPEPGETPQKNAEPAVHKEESAVAEEPERLQKEKPEMKQAAEPQAEGNSPVGGMDSVPAEEKQGRTSVKERWMAPTLSELFIDRNPNEEVVSEASEKPVAVEEPETFIKIEKDLSAEKEPAVAEKASHSLAEGIRKAVDQQFEGDIEETAEVLGSPKSSEEGSLEDTREFTAISGTEHPKGEPLVNEQEMDDGAGESASDILKAAAQKYGVEPPADRKATHQFSAISNTNAEKAKRQEEEAYSHSDREIALEELEKERGGIVFRVVALSLMAVFGIYLLLANAYRVALLPVFDLAGDPTAYLAVNTILLVLAAGVFYLVIENGLRSLFRWRLNHNSLVSVLTVFALLQAFISFLDINSIARSNVHLCAPVVVIALLLHSIGQLVVTESKYRGMKAFYAEGDKYAIYLLDDEEAGSGLTRGLVDSYPLVAARKKAHTLEPFAQANLYDSADRTARFLVPVALCCGLVFAGVSLIKNGDLFMAAGVFVMVLCAFVPFGYLLSSGIPLLRGAVRLGGKGAVLDTAELVDYADVNVVTLTGHDLFPEGSVQMYGIKTFSGARVDEALLDAASVVHAADGVLKDVFARILDDDESLLQPVDTLLYEDAMGLTAWIKNKRVLIGNRELMENHGVRVPSRDYENRYLDQGHDLIYLSTGGDLSAVFLVQLKALPEVQEMLRRLNSNHIRIALKSVDALLTKEKLAQVFDLPEESFKVIPSRLHERFDQVNPVQEKAEAGIMSVPGFFGYCRTLITAKQLHSALTLGMAIQVAAVVLGLIWVALFTLVFPIGLILPFTMLVYQLAWLLITCVVAVAKPLT